MTPQPAFDPDYPTPSALAYRDGFLQGALERDLRGIPDLVLSWAIDRAIAAQATSVPAGRVFADTYYRIQMRRDYHDPQRRNGVQNRHAYLLACYEKELNEDQTS